MIVFVEMGFYVLFLKSTCVLSKNISDNLIRNVTIYRTIHPYYQQPSLFFTVFMKFISCIQLTEIVDGNNSNDFMQSSLTG